MARRAPGLVGAGWIGRPLRGDPGLWSGHPAPVLTLQWRRDGWDIPGATDGVYVPRPEDDRARLGLRVSARNAVGGGVADSPEIVATFEPPVAFGTLPDIFLPQNSGAHVVNAPSDFTGAAVTFSVTGAGVAIDPISGALSISTEVLRAGLEVDTRINLLVFV